MASLRSILEYSFDGWDTTHDVGIPPSLARAALGPDEIRVMIPHVQSRNAVVTIMNQHQMTVQELLCLSRPPFTCRGHWATCCYERPYLDA